MNLAYSPASFNFTEKTTLAFKLAEIGGLSFNGVAFYMMSQPDMTAAGHHWYSGT
ncbi:hypothetical protein JMY91_09925 [Brenneria goodwinii]|nr:hypothetical protein [Brenneria goodwinii]